MHTTGPTLVKGGPGTGKSTVALYRIKSLLDQLLQIGQSQPKILFITYTNALIKSSQQQLQQLLGPRVQYVQINTADSVAYTILEYFGQARNPTLLTSNQEAYQYIRQAITVINVEGTLMERRIKKQSIDHLTIDYLWNEFNVVIIGRQINTVEEYLNTPRDGRKLRLNATQRTALWQVYQRWLQLLQVNNKETWQQRRTRAERQTKRSPLYKSFDAVIIDEAQDLDPNSLKMLVQLCKASNRLFITADANQSIYNSGFSWSDIRQDLRFQGRTNILRANYRSTEEIGEATQSYLHHAGQEAAERERQYINHGQRPEVQAVNSSKHEIQLLIHFFKQASHTLHLSLGSCAILCPSDNIGRLLASTLNQRNIAATYMSGRDLDLSLSGIKVLTFKSSKGLEFPIVALAGFVNSNYPPISSDATQEETDEFLERERRILYVAMTRAMRALLIIIPGGATLSPLLSGFDRNHWNVGRPI